MHIIAVFRYSIRNMRYRSSILAANIESPLYISYYINITSRDIQILQTSINLCI